MNTTALLPNPAHEYFAELSAVPVESIAAELESRLRARHGAPAGFHLKLTAGDITDMLSDPDWSGEWDGPNIQLDGSRILTSWNRDTGIYFFVDHESDDPWPICQAGPLSAAIQSLATIFTPDYGAPTATASKAPHAPATGPIQCEAWCWEGDGHPDASLVEDQHCWSDSKNVQLSIVNSKAPVDEPSIVELYMHRSSEGGELVVGINPDRVHGASEFTKAEWDQFVLGGNELWEAAK